MTSITDKFSHYCVPNYNPLPYTMIRGEKSVVFDDQGKDYIDLAGGIAVTALGHNHPTLAQALHTASQGIWHLSNYFTNKYAVDLAEKLCNATFCERVFFANSGSEANEAALKLARKYGKDVSSDNKNNIVACTDAFHGRTLFSVSVGGQEKYSAPFAPLPAGIEHIALNDLAALEATIDDTCCAFIVEPVQGEGGVINATTEFLQKARQLCTKHNALLIFDEVQCGMGRTGELFAYMKNKVTPDILTSAKALGCGVPISAMLTTATLAQTLTQGTHGSTFGGNPLACAVASSAFDIINQPQLLAGVNERNTVIMNGLDSINQELNIFTEIRGNGLLIGCELQPKYHHLGSQVISAGLKNGVVLLVAAGGQVIRLAPALNIPFDQLNAGLERLHTTLTQILAQT